jgi:hypothetical protein
MQLTIRLLGAEVFHVSVGLSDREETETESGFVSNTGGSYEIAGESEVEWEESEEDYDPEYDNRRAPFGFRHA